MGAWHARLGHGAQKGASQASPCAQQKTPAQQKTHVCFSSRFPTPECAVAAEHSRPCTPRVAPARPTLPLLPTFPQAAAYGGTAVGPTGGRPGTGGTIQGTIRRYPAAFGVSGQALANPGPVPRACAGPGPTARARPTRERCLSHAQRIEPPATGNDPTGTRTGPRPGPLQPSALPGCRATPQTSEVTTSTRVPLPAPAGPCVPTPGPPFWGLQR
jgi:hypothetical protein